MSGEVDLSKYGSGGGSHAVTDLSYTEAQSKTLWKAHEQSHELEQKALTVALTANDKLLETIQGYIIKYIDSELRKIVGDNANLRQQISDQWLHHNADVHVSHLTSHEREHQQTQNAIDKAEKTALSLSQSLGADVQRTNVALGNLVTKDQMATELKSADGRISLLERGESHVGGRDAGVAMSWSVLVAVGTIALAIGFGLHALIR